MQPPLITGPVPPYNNLPIEPQNYLPRQFFISDIVLGQTTDVTTTASMDFVVGQLVRLLIPKTSGCRQLNEQTGYVLDVGASNEVTVSIDSSQNVDPFTASASPQQPQIIPVGDVNTGVQNAGGRRNSGTYIPGSFINIS